MSLPNEEDRIVIHANSNVSRGKFAAAAVHAALTAAGVHPGQAVIVLGAKPRDIEHLGTVIHDAGRTEVEQGTVTAGTDWRPDHDTLVERFAAAMWWQEFGYDRGVTWEQRVQQELDHRRDPSWSGPVARYRRLARAALSAIGGGSC